MIRKILAPETNTIVVELPDDYIGKEIELLAFRLNEETTAISNGESQSSESLKKKLEGLTFSSGGYKFNRDEANEYE